MSKFVKYKLKDGRQIRGRYDYDTDKVLISREDLEGLLNESDVSYEQARQLQIIIENLEEIRAEAARKALNKIRAEIDTARFVDKRTKQCKNANASGLEVALEIIDKYRKEQTDGEQ